MIFLVAMAAVWPIALIVVSVVRGLNPIYRQLTFALGAPVGDDADSASALNSGGCAPGAGHRLGYYRPGGNTQGFLRPEGRDSQHPRRLTYAEMLAVLLVIDLLGIILDALASRLLHQHRMK